MKSNDEDITINIGAKTDSKSFDDVRKKIQGIGKEAEKLERSSKKLSNELNRGLNKALQQAASQGGLATGALAKMGPTGLAAAAAVGTLALGLRTLVSESRRLTEESAKLALSTDQYQKSLGITIPLTKEAIAAGNELGKTWNNLSTSAQNLALNALPSLIRGFKTFFTGTAGLFAPGPVASSFVGPQRPTDATMLRNRVLTADRLAEEEEKRLEEVKKLAEAQKRLRETYLREIEQLNKEGLSLIGPGDFPGVSLAQRRREGSISVPSVFAGLDPASVDEFGLFPPGSAEAGIEAGFRLTVGLGEKAAVSLGDLNEQMAGFAHLADVLGPKWASAFQGLTLGLSGFGSIQGGFKMLGSTTGVLGTLAGIGGIAGGFGALAAPLISLLSGIGGPNIGRDVNRDIGGNISSDLAKLIEDSGSNPQMFLREIFEEGAIGAGRLAEEVGDLFSFFERGDISERGLMGELNELLPVLIANFDDLGETGEEQIDRIIQAAEDMGVELGAAGDQLDRLARGVPELTLEGFASQFGMTPEQQAALQGLGLGIQTNEERVAETLDAPLELLKELAPFLDKLGVSLEELPDFLEATNLDLGELGAKLELPPELAAQLAALNPATAADQTGAAVANHLLPGFQASLRQLGDDIIRGFRDAVAANS